MIKQEVIVGNTGLTIPTLTIKGKKAGKTMLITAGIHGSEYCSILAAQQLATEIKEEEVMGTIIIAILCNSEAFYQFQRLVVPLDNRNLNRVFPGDKDGSASKQLAYVIETELQDKADYHMDLHGGDLHEEVMPFVYYVGQASDAVVETAKEMAKALSVSVRVKSSSTTGCYNHAGVKGIPAILIERGGRGIWDQETVTLYKKDVLSVLAKMQFLPTKYLHPNVLQQEIVHTTYLDSPNTGFWFPAKKVGEEVEKGECLGRITDVYGEIVNEIMTEHEGIVLYQTVSLGISKGDSLIAYGRCVF